MIIPPRGVDDLGQEASASTTFLRYVLHLQYRGHDSAHGPIEITREELSHINIGDASRFLLFPHDAKRWRSSAVTGARRAPFISTMDTGQQCVIRLHQEGKGGRQLSRPAGSLPRTVLSATNAAENPTALLARREMQSWRLLQLEPSATHPGSVQCSGTYRRERCSPASNTLSTGTA